MLVTPSARPPLIWNCCLHLCSCDWILDRLPGILICFRRRMTFSKRTLCSSLLFKKKDSSKPVYACTTISNSKQIPDFRSVQMSQETWNTSCTNEKCSITFVKENWIPTDMDTTQISEIISKLLKSCEKDRLRRAYDSHASEKVLSLLAWSWRPKCPSKSLTVYKEWDQQNENFYETTIPEKFM